MFIRSLWAGIGRGVRRLKLALLLYLVNTVLALVLTAPVYNALGAAVGNSGFSPELVRNFDLVLWVDILTKIGPTLRGSMAQLVCALLLYQAWKIASRVGIVHALHGDARGDFWTGTRRYATRALFVSLLFGLPLVLFVVLAGGISWAFQERVWPGEAGGYWTTLVLAPVLLLVASATAGVMRDYGLAALVIDKRSVWQAWRIGLAWPFKHGSALGLYGFWLVVGGALVALPTLVETQVEFRSTGGAIAVTLLAQLLLLLRAFVQVAWLGSETAFYEGIRARQVPPVILPTPPPPQASLPFAAPVPLAVAAEPEPEFEPQFGFKPEPEPDDTMQG